jgi:hypothetical protein
MTDELRQIQIEQLKLIQAAEALISTCSKRKIRDYPGAPINRNGFRLMKVGGELVDVSIKFTIAFLDANEAHLLTPEEYRELSDQNLKAQKISARAIRVLQ